VENLLMIGGFPVERLSAEIFPSRPPLRENLSRPGVHAFSRIASLDRRAKGRTIRFVRDLPAFPITVTRAVHRFEESIGGRPYLIEVAAVSPDRWRAYIVRIPGVPTALMPFYGRTPDEAAGNLSAWLTRAHAHAAGPRPV
jgi:hypothetical protein